MIVEDNMIHRVNVGDILRRRAGRYANQTAIIEGDRRLSYTAFNAEVNRAARGLLSLGLEKGDRLAILASNSTEYLTVYFACAKTGITIVPINLALLKGEISYIFKDAEVKAAVVENAFLEKLPLDLGTLKDVVVLDEQPPEANDLVRYHHWDAILEGQDDAELYCEVQDRDPLQILYTSGTTSNPKGVLSSHLSVYLQALGTAYDLKFTDRDVAAAMLPLFHTAQLNAFTAPLIVAGGTTVMMKKFEAIELMTLIEQEGITQIFGLPMMYRTLLDHPERQNYDLSTLRLCIYAMAPMPDDQLRRAIETFNCDFALLFGQTEMAPVTTVFRPEHQLLKPGAVGTPSVNVDVGIMDEKGRLLSENEVGEIVYRSPQTMEAYLNNKVETEEVFKYGWFHSGDYGYLDEDGMLWFFDRKKDIVKTGGENVASIEMEKTILQDPRVQNVAVVGLPHDYWSEALTAFVTPKEGESITEEEIIRFCKKRHGGFKIPKRVVFIEDFPMTSTGKIQKHKLRTEYKSLYTGTGVQL